MEYTKYIIEVEDTVRTTLDGKEYHLTSETERFIILDSILKRLTPYDENDAYQRGLNDAYKALSKLPSAQPALDEWCTDCKEYDHEQHCCPRWNRVIRTTLNDMKGENNDTSLDN